MCIWDHTKINLSVSKVFLTHANNVGFMTDCLYYETFPLEILFVFERRRREMSTWIHPVNTFAYHKEHCTCYYNPTNEYSNECLVLFKNKLYDYNMKQKIWSHHVCLPRPGRELDELELIDMNCGFRTIPKLFRLDLRNLEETILDVMSRANFTRLYIDGTLN